MPIYRYKALNHKGETVTGYREFTDLLALERFISSNHMILLEVKEIPRPLFILAELLILQKVKRRDIIDFCRNLSLLMTGGIPLAESIRDLANTTKNKTLQNTLKAIYRDLEEGFLLSEALAKHPKIFPEVVVSLTKIGEETGDMGKMLQDAAQHLERVEEIISNTKRALIYPAFVIVAMTGAFLFWMLYVLPKVLNMFKTMGIKLPLATRILLAIVDFTNRFWFLAFIPPFLAVIFYVASRYDNRVKKALHWTIMKLPIFGPIIRHSIIAFFFEYFALMVSAGITISSTLEAMEEATSNLVLKDVIHRVVKMLEDRASLQEAFDASHFFEPFVVRMIAVGENTGELDKQLKYIADFYIERVNRMVEVISKTLEPVILAGAAVLLLLIILGLLGPVYNMLGKIKG